MVYTETHNMTETKLKRIAELSAANPKQVFTNLMHLFNEESLLTCYHELDGKKAVGIDRIDKETYGKSLKGNLKNLVEQMQRMAYIPGAVRQVLIPKEGKPGATRPLGISNFEDKLVQKMMQKVLESIYDKLFYDESYGFREGRGCHDAIKALRKHLNSHTVETVIDVDLSNFFGSISHEKVLKVIGEKIKDKRLLRYLSRMFKAGILADGELTVSDEGVPQGSVCSPIIANIFAHEVIDKWMHETVEKHCMGKVKMVRYADDLVISCQYDSDAQRIKSALAKRLGKFGLKMNEDKTKLVSFSKAKIKKGEKQGTFNFLGFTFYLGKDKEGRFYLVKLKTDGKRFRSKLKKVNEWAKRNRNKVPMKQLMKIAIAKLRGHIQYYGMSHNYAMIQKFHYAVKKILFKWLNRRSQRKSFNWEKYQKFLSHIDFPEPKIYHRLF